MSSSSAANAPQRPGLSLSEILDRLELMAQALRSLSDPVVKWQIICEMRVLLWQAEKKL